MVKDQLTCQINYCTEEVITRFPPTSLYISPILLFVQHVDFSESFITKWISATMLM